MTTKTDAWKLQMPPPTAAAEAPEADDKGEE